MGGMLKGRGKSYVLSKIFRSSSARRSGSGMSDEIGLDWVSPAGGLLAQQPIFDLLCDEKVVRGESTLEVLQKIEMKKCEKL